MNLRASIAVALVGAAGIAITSAAIDMPPGEALKLAAITGVAVLLAGTLGAGLVFALRGRPIGIQVTAIVLVCVGTVGVGALAAAKSMFLSQHDINALLVIIVAAGTMSALVAMGLGRRVSAASRSLELAVRRIGVANLDPGAADPTMGHTGSTGPTTGEFTALGRELDEMSRRLEDAQTRERAAEASRRELTAWVSHDLRTPLAGIRAIAEALEDGVVEDPETVARYHRTLRIETDRLARLVDELFELSVIHAGALRLHFERVALGDLVSDALAASAPTARARGVRLEGRLNSSAPVLEISPSDVTRVLRNLLENAIQHTPSDGSVSIEAGSSDDDAYVSVADQCGGIPSDDLGRVFDLAFRGEAARTPGPDGGAGLGLAIARGIVEAHHGEISVSNVGSGCRFTVRLPLSQPSST